jgi:hypothetical protein
LRWGLLNKNWVLEIGVREAMFANKYWNLTVTLENFMKKERVHGTFFD